MNGDAVRKGQSLLEVWDPSIPLPQNGGWSRPEGASDVVVHRSTSDPYRFLHDCAVVSYQNALLAAWYNCPELEMVEHSLIRGRWSFDAGRTWSEPYVIAEDPEHQFMYVPVVFHVHRNQLIAYVSRMTGPDIVTDCQCFIYDDSTATWTRYGSIGEGLLLNCPPQRMSNGRLIMAGRVAREPGTMPLDPAVALSNGDPTSPWTVVRLLPEGRLPDGSVMACPETTVLVNECNITAFVRHKDGRSLVFHSTDYGITWSDPREHNLPMRASKVFAGTLSTGQQYVIFNAVTGKHRDTLAIAVSGPDGGPFDRAWSIQEGYSTDLGLGPNWSYPYAIERDGRLYVVYTGQEEREKDACVMTTIPVASLG